MKKLSFLLFLLLGLHYLPHAQTIDLMWQKSYQGIGENSDRFNKIISDGSGNFVCTGYTYKSGNYRATLSPPTDLIAPNYTRGGSVLRNDKKNKN